MVEYIEKGGLYDVESDAPDFGLAGRAQSWYQAQIAAEELSKAPPSGMKLRIWKNRWVSDWPWFIKWVPKEDAP